ncbi:MAG TPA: dihydrolipoyl dehydrogenase, partial [Gemmatimonadetes bacterium]|nr:dihydrolipoyl dehydrogenase [Gemmatimonadota bacterium]
MECGRLVGGGGVEVEASDGSRQLFAASHVILATGSRPRDIPILPIDEERVWSSTGALFQTETPESLAVVGAGAVGMEFADIYDAYGTKVTVIEALDRILPLEDADSSAAVQRSFKKRGVDVFTGAMVESADIGKTSVELRFKDKQGADHALEVEHVLSA